MNFKKAFDAHRNSAKFRNIPFLFSFEEWKEWWLTDDRWHKRGRGNDHLCMARRGDIGPYHPDNVVCLTQRQNKRDVDPNKRIGNRLRGGASAISKKVTTPDGAFPSLTDAAEYYDISKAGINWRVKHWKGWFYP